MKPTPGDARSNGLPPQPFFLYFSFNHVHFPQFASAQFHNSSLAGTYGDSVAEMDWTVGNIVKTLAETGLVGLHNGNKSLITVTVLQGL